MKIIIRKSIKNNIPPTGVALKSTISYKELFGQSLSMEEILGEFSQTNIGELLPTIAKLIAIHYATNGNSNIVLNQIFDKAKHINYGPTVNFIVKVLEHSVDAETVLNSPQMLLNVAKFLLVYGDDNTLSAAPVLGDPLPFVRVIFLACILTDYYEGEASRDFILMESVQNGVFNRWANGLSIIQRSVECYLKLSKQKEKFPTGEFLDISKLFMEATGLELNSFLKFLTALVATYDLNSTADELAWTNKLFSHIDHYMKSIEYDVEETEKLFGLISGRIEDFRQSHQNSLNKRWDFSFFRNKPIIRTKDVFYPLDRKLLIDKVWDGLFWMILDHIDDSIKNKFRVFFGRLFETYCTELILSIEEKIRGKVIPEFEYLPGQKSPDLFLSYGKDLIVIDFKAKRFQMNDTLVRGNIEGYKKDLTGIFITPAEKIYKHLKKFSLLKECRIDIAKYNRIHCIIVSQGSLVGLSEIYREMDDLIREKGFYDELPVRTWNLLSIDEYEVLVGLLEKGKNLPNLLLRKASSEKYKFLSFNDFLAYTQEKFSIPSYIKKNIREWTEEMFGNIQ
ncbi:hypothetical protein ACWA2B_24885 [Paenibacillus sp. CMM36]